MSELSLGRQMLALIGVAGLAMAVAILGEPHEPDAALLFTLLPLWLRCAVWAGAGLLALTASVSRRWVRYAWGAVMLMPAFRVLSYAVSLILDLRPGGREPDATMAAEVIIWAVVSLAILLLARSTDAEGL